MLRKLYHLIKPLIVIPSYWRKGPFTAVDCLYDHPTDLLNPEETISKTLESLSKIRGDFDVLVLGAPTRSELGFEMDKTLLELIANLELPFHTFYFGYNHFNELIEILGEYLPKERLQIISNSGYGNIRNLGLLISHILDYNIMIYVDDDELVSDHDFVKKATEFVGTEINSKFLGLVLGFYINENGSVFLDESDVPWWELFWNKKSQMNQAFQIILDSKEPRLIETPFAFGGNMIIHRQCWKKVPFDPFIKRGEDMDYLRNVKYFGFEAKLDKSLSIEHRPPVSQTSYITKLGQDITRFLYAKAKLASIEVEPDDYDPYPGYFLKQTEAKVLLTELLHHIFLNQSQLLEIKNEMELFDNLRSLKFIFQEAQQSSQQHADSYIKFQKQWETLVQQLPSKFPSKIVTRV